MSTATLRVSNLHAWYGESHVLHGVDCHVNEGEVVTLLGRNGAGRTTTLRALLGLVRSRSGSVLIKGEEVVALPPHRIAHLGVGYCPEERGIYAMFPNLCERRRSQGSHLSGGEQQMLALARILRTGARLLLLDEIAEGLAPVIVQALSQTIQRLRRQGYTIVMVEQNFRFAAPLADRFYIMERGRIVEGFAATQLAAKMAMLHEFLGV